MREFVLRFSWRGHRYEERVKAQDDDLASAEIARKYPGCKIVSILHPRRFPSRGVPASVSRVGSEQSPAAQAAGRK